MEERTAGGSAFLEVGTVCARALQFRNGGPSWWERTMRSKGENWPMIETQFTVASESWGEDFTGSRNWKLQGPTDFKLKFNWAHLYLSLSLSQHLSAVPLLVCWQALQKSKPLRHSSILCGRLCLVCFDWLLGGNQRAEKDEFLWLVRYNHMPTYVHCGAKASKPGRWGGSGVRSERRSEVNPTKFRWEGFSFVTRIYQWARRPISLQRCVPI